MRWRSNVWVVIIVLVVFAIAWGHHVDNERVSDIQRDQPPSRYTDTSGMVAVPATSAPTEVVDTAIVEASPQSVRNNDHAGKHSWFDSSLHPCWPKLNPGEEVMSYTGFSLVYSEPHEQAAWVAYVLTSEMTRPKVKRRDNFRPDPRIATGTADHNDYRKSGFDRGHLAPAGDMGWSSESMDDSFYYSNMSPQRPQHNRGVWKRLEERMRGWAVAYDSIYLVTGPILVPGLPAIGPNEVSVPEAYYKAVLRFTENDFQAIAFIVPNEGSKEPLEHFAVSIDQLEASTGIDFFHFLPDSIERAVEHHFCLGCWDW